MGLVKSFQSLGGTFNACKDMLKIPGYVIIYHYLRAPFYDSTT